MCSKLCAVCLPACLSPTLGVLTSPTCYVSLVPLISPAPSCVKAVFYLHSLVTSSGVLLLYVCAFTCHPVVLLVFPLMFTVFFFLILYLCVVSCIIGSFQFYNNLKNISRCHAVGRSALGSTLSLVRVEKIVI